MDTCLPWLASYASAFLCSIRRHLRWTSSGLPMETGDSREPCLASDSMTQWTTAGWIEPDGVMRVTEIRPLLHSRWTMAVARNVHSPCIVTRRGTRVISIAERRQVATRAGQVSPLAAGHITEWMLQFPVKLLYRDEQGYKMGIRAWCIWCLEVGWRGRHPPICTRDGRNDFDGHFSGQEGAKQLARQEPPYKGQHGSLRCGACLHGSCNSDQEQ